MENIKVSILHTNDGYMFGCHVGDMSGNPSQEEYWGFDFNYDDCYVTKYSIPLSVLYTLSQYNYCFMWSILQKDLGLPHASELPDFEVRILRDGYDAMGLVLDYGQVMNKNVHLWENE